MIEIYSPSRVLRIERMTTSWPYVEGGCRRHAGQLRPGLLGSALTVERSSTEMEVL